MGVPLGELVALDFDVREPHVFSCLSRGDLLIGGMFVPSGEQLIASLAIARGTLARVLLALLCRVAAITWLSLDPF